MGEALLEISIPLDKDCFIEMECEFCKNRFMLHQDVYESEDNINFFCSICGLPNKINTFFVPEVLDKAQQMAMNYMLEDIDDTIGLIKTISFSITLLLKPLYDIESLDSCFA